MISSESAPELLPALGRNLTFAVFERLGLAIVAGRYDETTFPTELELSHRYGVSHSVIREAVKMLAAKGLVSVRARRGIVPEPEEAWNLLDTDILRWLVERGLSRGLVVRFKELRIAIEPEAAALAASAATADDYARIDHGLKEIVTARRGGGNMTEASVAFHVAILTAAHNPFYAQFQGLLRATLGASAHFSGLTLSLADHASVSEAIRAGDPDRARDHMRRIIDHVLAESRR
jgi:DNA-binding FadR family transcriptional regulator